MPLSSVPEPPKGREQQARAAKLTKDINSMQTQPPIQIPHQTNDTNNWPYTAIPRDAYDDDFATKQRNTMKNPYTGKPTTTVMHITKDDLEYQKRKAQVANNLKYQTWLINNIDMTDPKQGTSSLRAKKAVIKAPTRGLKRSVERQNRTRTTPTTVSRPRAPLKKTQGTNFFFFYYGM